MLKIYCSECGSPTEYSLNKPKFCSGCGNPFSGTKKEQPVVQKVLMQKPTIASKRPNIQVEDFEDDDLEVTEVNEVPDLDGLNFDIQIQPDNVEKIGNIIGSSIEGNSLRKNREKVKINKKEQLENFQKEAGAIKPKTRVRSNKK